MERVLVDTNIILRYLVDGDPKLAELAQKYGLWLPEGVIFETAFTLKSFYKQPREKICEWLYGLLMKPNVESERELLINSVLMFRDNPKFGLVDCYLANLANREKIKLVTNDKKLAKVVHP